MFNILILLLGLLAAPAMAQTCPTRPSSDSSNACANTAFVGNSFASVQAGPLTIGKPPGGYVVISGSPSPHTGYISWYRPNGTRVAFLGNDPIDNSLTLDMQGGVFRLKNTVSIDAGTLSAGAPPALSVTGALTGADVEANATRLVVLDAGGASPTSVQLLLKNTAEVGLIGGQDYGNEVHLRLQAGKPTASGGKSHRAYINFADNNGEDQWLTGRNASDVWILHDNNDGHKLWFESTGGTAPLNTGNSYLNSGGTGAVVINSGNNDGDNLGTGGFSVWGGGTYAGGTYPRPLLFGVAPNTTTAIGNSDTGIALHARHNQSGYAPMSLQLDDLNRAANGSGLFSFNSTASTIWFTGVAYNASALAWTVAYKSSATFDPEASNISNGLLSVHSTGNVVLNKAAVATNATDGFLYIATSAGPPTGTPTAYTGRVPLVYDTVNHKFWIYDGSWLQPKTPSAELVTWQ